MHSPTACANVATSSVTISQLAQSEFGNIKEIARRGCKSSARNQPQTGLTFAPLGRINRPA
ncbi:hypothetical protein GCM10010987_00840 [Bradyrhizobium guangdongense]|uniref:Uncharacterized protein n=1 Tax=Bradyrhizobium guangdongense TaxID=1325090 RepID=A0AA87VZB5_9BRAD|nr:hypothetical protein GCM10010987_00840 [Bradyrhizobium guangdongense]